MFSNAAFAFSEQNQASVAGVLDRLAPGGGGDSFVLGDDSSARGWIEAIGAILDPASAGTDRPHFRALSGGMEGGVDVAAGSGARLGGVIGYEHSSLSDTDSGASSEDTLRLGVYGEASAGPLVVSAALDYATARQSFDRASGFGVSVSSRHIDETLGGIEASWPLSTAGTAVTPRVGVTLAWISASGFQETDAQSSAFAVQGASANAFYASPFAKVTVSHVFTQGSGLEITPAAELGYRYDAAAAGLDATLIAADGTPFVGDTSRLSKSSALIGVSLTAHQGKWSGFLRYQADLAGDWNDQHLQAGLRWSF